MNRREFLRSCFTAAAGMTAFGAKVTADAVALSNESLKVSVGKKRPNVIYILADDLGYGDLGVFGQLKIKTPNLDKMAAEGMRLTQHYSGSTVCAPSRCSLMTGLHTGHCYVRGNKGTNGYDLHIPDESFTVAELFKQNGYTTACTGKWGLGGPATSGHPNNQGFDYFYGYLGQAKAHFYYPNFLWENSEQIMLNDAAYSHDLITDKALKFVADNKDQPFFLYMPFTIPHAELVVPEDEILEEYRSLGWPENPHPDGQHYGPQPTPHAAFAAMITRMDRDIGRVMKLIKKLGLDDDTIIMFTSDNGPHKEGGADPNWFDSNGIYRGIKRDLYEGGIRVPFISRWPGKIKPGTTSGHISAFWDFLPTCADLLGVDSPKDLDGISFLPALLQKGTQKQHDHMYWEFHEQGGKQAVVKGKWKAIRLNVKTTADPPVKLHDLDNDPSETTDVTAANPQIAQQLKDLIDTAHVPSSIFKFYGE